LLDLLVGIEHDASGRVVDEADWDAHLQLAAPRLVQPAANQSRAQDVELGLRHRALQAEKQSIVEMGGVVDSDQRIAQPRLPISACTRPRISSRMVPFVNLLIESERTSRLTDDAGQNIVF
jgi:hypothetical protein